MIDVSCLLKISSIQRAMGRGAPGRLELHFHRENGRRHRAVRRKNLEIWERPVKPCIPSPEVFHLTHSLTEANVRGLLPNSNYLYLSAGLTRGRTQRHFPPGKVYLRNPQKLGRVHTYYVHETRLFPMTRSERIIGHRLWASWIDWQSQWILASLVCISSGFMDKLSISFWKLLF